MTIFCIGLAMHLMEEKRDTKRDILPGFHRKKIEFEFKLLYYNQKRRALSSSFFSVPRTRQHLFPSGCPLPYYILKRFDCIGSRRFPVICHISFVYHIFILFFLIIVIVHDGFNQMSFWNFLSIFIIYHSCSFRLQPVTAL